MSIPPADVEVIERVVRDLVKDLGEALFYIVACLTILGVIAALLVSIFA